MSTTVLAAARAEVALAKKLLALLNDEQVSVFFQEHSEPMWSEFEALDAWTLWVSKKLTADELRLYRDAEAYADVMDIHDLKLAVASESNRIPDADNADGY